MILIGIGLIILLTIGCFYMNYKSREGNEWQPANLNVSLVLTIVVLIVIIVLW